MGEQQLWWWDGQQARGPEPLGQVVRRVRAGSLPRDVLVAEPGAPQWRQVTDHEMGAAADATPDGAPPWEPTRQLLERLLDGAGPRDVLDGLTLVDVMRLMTAWSVVSDRTTARHGPGVENQMWEESTDGAIEWATLHCAGLPGWSDEVSRSVSLVWKAAGERTSDVAPTVLTLCPPHGMVEPQAYLAGCLALIAAARAGSAAGIDVAGQLRQVVAEQQAT